MLLICKLQSGISDSSYKIFKLGRVEFIKKEE